jgi:hypothetical protein
MKSEHAIGSPTPPLQLPHVVLHVVGRDDAQEIDVVVRVEPRHLREKHRLGSEHLSASAHQNNTLVEGYPQGFDESPPPLLPRNARSIPGNCRQRTHLHVAVKPVVDDEAVGHPHAVGLPGGKGFTAALEAHGRQGKAPGH